MTFSIHRGTNISHWLSQSNQRGEKRRAFFTQDDVNRIAGWGMDHIRLPIDEEQMWAEGGTREPEAFDLMNAALDWCESAGLKVIVDLHILRSHSFMDTDPALYTDVKEAQKFAWLWSDLSSVLRGRSEERVAYELMNEPVAKNDADWNRVLRYPLQAIRDREPTRTVVIGSNKWSQVHTFPALDVPDDRHLLLTFHFYNPMLITHYRASWTPKIAQYTGPIQYPGKQIPDAEWAKLPEAMRDELKNENRDYGRAQMERDIALPISVAKKHHLPLHCGEFGVVKNAPDAVRIAWYRDLLDVFRAHDIAWSNWDYKGSFGLIDAAGHETAVGRGLGLRER